MLNKKLLWVFVVVVLLISLTGCIGIGPKTAQLEISFDPNPVTCENHCYWKVIVSETNGVGVSLKSVTQDVYVGEELVKHEVSDEAWIEEVLGSSYLPPFSSASLTAGCGCVVSYEIFTYTGIDDNNHEVEATERIDIL